MSRAGDRSRPRVRYPAALLTAALVLLTLPVMLVGTATPAAAAERAPTGEGGNYLDRARCSVAVSSSTWSAGATFKYRCYFDPATIPAGSVRTRGFDLQPMRVAGGEATFQTTSFHTCGTRNEDLDEGWVERTCTITETSGFYNWSSAFTGETRSASVLFEDAGGTSTGSLRGGWAAAGQGTSPEHTLTISSEYGAWPVDWFAGGQPQGGTLEGYAAGTECERTLFQDENGAWFAVLFARNLESVPDGWTSNIKVWSGTWQAGHIGTPTEGDSDHRVIVPLPPVSTMPSWGWYATFHQRLTLPAGVYGEVPDLGEPEDEGEFRDDEGGLPWWWTPAALAALGVGVTAVNPGAGVAYWSKAGPAIGAMGVWKALTGALGGGGEPELEVRDGRPPAGARFLLSGTQVGAGQYDTYEVVCSVRVDPSEAENEEAPPPVWPPRGPDAPPPPDEAGGDTCDAGLLGSIPFIGRVFDGFARVLCGLGNIIGKLFSFLRALFVPGDLDWESLIDTADTNFPFNIGTAIVEAVTGITDVFVGAIDTGDACPAVPVGEFVEAGNAGSPHDVDAGGAAFALPTPASAGCGAPGGRPELAAAGDLWGFAAATRQLLVYALYVGFAIVVFKSVSSRDPDELEAGL